MKLSELLEQNGFDLGNLKESFDLIDGISKHIIAESDEVLAKQHQISENIYFLIKGKATFTKYFETKSIASMLVASLMVTVIVFMKKRESGGMATSRYSQKL